MKRFVPNDALGCMLLVTRSSELTYRARIFSTAEFVPCVGVRDQDRTTVPQNHSPLSFADESALPVDVKVMTNLALDYLFGGK